MASRLGRRSREALSRCRILLEPEAGPEEDRPVGVKIVKVWAVGNACDAEGAQDRWDLAVEMLGDAFPLQQVSTVTGAGIEELRREIIDVLDLIRVYTKQPGKPADMTEPFVLTRGTTVIEAAARVHKDIANALKTARVWGSAKHDGSQVHRDHVLEDGDVIEFRA